MRHQDQTPAERFWLAMRHMDADLRLQGMGRTDRVIYHEGSAEEAQAEEHRAEWRHLTRQGETR